MRKYGIYSSVLTLLYENVFVMATFISNVHNICHRNELAFSKVDLFHLKENFGKLPGRCKGYVSNSVVDTGEMICLSSIPVLPLKFS